MFDIHPASAVPIWRQIEEGMRRMISLGTLRPGAAVPSVRDLARDLSVNPNTVARAYQRLSDAGVFVVRRGEGTFVADAPAQLRKAQRNEKLRDSATSYAGTALAVGASLEDAAAELENAYERLTREHRSKA
ncbi:MAG: GntR family transcriptional regulator [Acidobacteria bacterium]|nr:GntR family transcriptional regulator [Acidobacteriota bacterium]MBV9477082.1 GntR family transcriptional regulator [Acidobacteriota bacterium]